MVHSNGTQMSQMIITTATLVKIVEQLEIHQVYGMMLNVILIYLHPPIILIMGSLSSINDYSSDEDYANIINNSGGKWNDLRCTNDQYGIIEID